MCELLSIDFYVLDAEEKEEEEWQQKDWEDLVLKVSFNC